MGKKKQSRPESPPTGSGSFDFTVPVVCAYQRPPLTRGLSFVKQKTGGENIFPSCFSPSDFACGESTSLKVNWP